MNETLLTKQQMKEFVMAEGKNPEDAIEYLNGLELYKLEDIERFVNL